jgi:hypothetical protein
MAFNKLFVMLPVMLAARKIDGEDPNVVYWLRVAYATIQALCVLVVAFTYIQASGAAGKLKGVIYVPPQAVVRIAFYYIVVLFCFVGCMHAWHDTVLHLLSCVLLTVAHPCDSRTLLPTLLFYFISFVAIRRSQCQKEIHGKRLWRPRLVHSSILVGKYTLWHLFDGRFAFLQRHGGRFGHSNHHGTTQLD